MPSPAYTTAEPALARGWLYTTEELNHTIHMTFNNGSLGSRIDEERSEVRNVMRFAASVSHRVFERTWHRE